MYSKCAVASDSLYFVMFEFVRDLKQPKLWLKTSIDIEFKYIHRCIVHILCLLFLSSFSLGQLSQAFVYFCALIILLFRISSRLFSRSTMVINSSTKSRSVVAFVTMLCILFILLFVVYNFRFVSLFFAFISNINMSWTLKITQKKTFNFVRKKNESVVCLSCILVLGEMHVKSKWKESQPKQRHLLRVRLMEVAQAKQASRPFHPDCNVIFTHIMNIFGEFVLMICIMNLKLRQYPLNFSIVPSGWCMLQKFPLMNETNLRESIANNKMQ